MHRHLRPFGSNPSITSYILYSSCLMFQAMHIIKLSNLHFFHFQRFDKHIRVLVWCIKLLTLQVYVSSLAVGCFTSGDQFIDRFYPGATDHMTRNFCAMGAFAVGTLVFTMLLYKLIGPKILHWCWRDLDLWIVMCFPVLLYLNLVWLVSKVQYFCKCLWISDELIENLM